MSNALECTAYVHSNRGEWEPAEKLYQQAPAANRTIGSTTGAAIDLTAIAASREAPGDSEGGKKLDQEALAIFAEVSDDGGAAYASNEKTSQLTMLGDLDKAQHYMKLRQRLIQPQPALTPGLLSKRLDPKASGLHARHSPWGRELVTQARANRLVNFP